MDTVQRGRNPPLRGAPVRPRENRACGREKAWVEGVNTKPKFPSLPSRSPWEQASFLPRLVSGQGTEKQKKNEEGSYQSLNSFLKEKKQRSLPCFLSSGKDQGLVARAVPSQRVFGSIAEPATSLVSRTIQPCVGVRAGTRCPRFYSPRLPHHLALRGTDPVSDASAACPLCVAPAQENVPSAPTRGLAKGRRC